MAVFTVVGLAQLQDWMQHYPSLGQASAIRGISSGIENSNYFIDTDRGEFVLTLFEVLKFDEAPFYLELMHHLAQHGIPVPAPVPNDHGGFCTALMGKPATIVSKLQGQSQMQPQPQHCAKVGAMLAKMHDAGATFPNHQKNLRGLDWWVKTRPTVIPFIPSELQNLLNEEVQAQCEFAQSETYRQLPEGPIHADLFRNNVMFDQDQLSGFFDFYFAGWDKLLFDVAVTVNDWCIDVNSGEFDVARLRAFLMAYHAERPFNENDEAGWNLMLRAAAMRFWISRLYDFYLPREAEMLTPHDPRHFERILSLRKKFHISLFELIAA